MSVYSTVLGEFCDNHCDWEKVLSGYPFYLKIKRKDGFVIFNYNQLESDFSQEIVREARGIIFRENEWEVPVCHAFDKFGNYGEEYVPDLDWGTIKVSEKIDGSIMKLWCYNGCWNLSTNGNIDAKDAPTGDVRKEDFAQLFWEGVIQHIRQTDSDGKLPALIDWFNSLNPDCTYIFELVSPYNRVVIPYEHTDVYFLGARHNATNYQWGCDEVSAKILHVDMLPRPKIYSMSSLEDIINAANSLPWDEEDYVCYDKDFSRCKIKSPKYVMAHFSRNNNVITRWHLINVILKGEMNEFTIYASDYKEQIEYVKGLMENFTACVDYAGKLARGLRKLDRPRAAEVIKHFDTIAQPIMFFNYNEDMSGEDYVSGWDAYKWERILIQYEKFKKRYGE